MIAPRAALALALTTLMAACAATSPATRSGLTVIPVPPPMPATPIPPDGRPADLQTAYGGACTLAVLNEVPARISGVQHVQADGASLTEYPAQGDSVRVDGVGRYYRGGGSDWQPFAFQCVYDTARASITDFDLRPL